MAPQRPCAQRRRIAPSPPSGSESLTLLGDIDVGHSAGLLALKDVTIEGSTRMEIFGSCADEYDRIVLGNGTDFGGWGIDIHFVDFEPELTETFDLFDPFPGDDLADILATASIHAPVGWKLDMTSGMLAAVAVPEPSVMGLLLVGGLMLVRRRQAA